MPLTLPFELTKHQQKIVDGIVDNIQCGVENIILSSSTATGKSVIMAAVAYKLQYPTIILSHNKVLAKQLYDEFSGFLKDEPVNYFVSHFDTFTAEAYLPSIDKYIAKDATIDKEIDHFRMRATRDIIETDFNLTVASVSAIFGAGIPKEYFSHIITLKVGDKYTPHELSRKLVTHSLYERVPHGQIDWFDQFQATGEQFTLRNLDGYDIVITLGFDEIESIEKINLISSEKTKLQEIKIHPTKHFFSIDEMKTSGLEQMEIDLYEQIEFFKRMGKPLEAARIKERTEYDMSMIEEIGYTNGMENYVKYFYPENLIHNRPICLLDYYRFRFGTRFLTIIDECHSFLPQIKSMLGGQRTLKQTLIDFGFRLPSCLYNRPLNFQEFMDVTAQKLYVSATPANYELSVTEPENIHTLEIRPTGIIDPEVFILPTKYQVDDITKLLREQQEKKEMSLIITLTIKDSEHLTDFLRQAGFNVAYIHSGIKPKERLTLFEKIREGTFEVVVGINMMREGIDLPDVSLVCILGADKEGFLRNKRSLTQIAGRAARNTGGRVYLFADVITKSIQGFLDETQGRRERQKQYNSDNDIIPVAIIPRSKISVTQNEPNTTSIKKSQKFHERRIRAAVKDHDFEEAAKLRDAFKKFHPIAFKDFSLKKSQSKVAKQNFSSL